MEYLVINVDCFMSSDKILDAQSYWNHRCRSVEISFYTFYITLFERFQFLDVHNPLNFNLAHISHNGVLHIIQENPINLQIRDENGIFGSYRKGLTWNLVFD